MKDKIGLLLVNLLGLALLVYTGSRTADFIGLTLPANQQALAFVGLAAFDGGLVGWAVFYLRGARGPWQRAIALLMIVASLAGVILAFAGDTLFRAAQRGTLAAADPAMTLTVIYGMAAVIALNIAALIGVHVADPAARRQAAEQDAQDQIADATTTQIAERTAALAAELAPQRAQAWLDDMRARHGAPALLPAPKPPTPQPDPDPVPVPALLSTNGNGHGPKALKE